MASPVNLKYTEEHEWVSISENIATVGITDHAQGELGEIVYVEIDTLEEVVEKGEVFGTIEAVKTTSELFMPLSGKVLEFNPELDEDKDDNPAAINDDPYESGWIIKIEISDLSEIEGLLSAQDYEALIT